jgi:hypothetical protein
MDGGREPVGTLPVKIVGEEADITAGIANQNAATIRESDPDRADAAGGRKIDREN